MLWLEQHTEFINALNVYPVPDGDTGTNMLLTLQVAHQEIANLDHNKVGAVARAFAHGALMGARGNSGVILSQLLRGLARRLDDQETFDAASFAEALNEATVTAYKGVIRPVEGTILTVAREAAEAAKAAASETNDLRIILERVADAAREAVARTPSLLPVLREAGVVDAGGQGLYIFLEGMVRYMRGESVQTPTISQAARLASRLEAEYGYEVQFILQGHNLDVSKIRADIAAMGESVLVVGDERTLNVHIHTDQPGTPLNYACALGTLTQIHVENLQEQYQEFIQQRFTPVTPPVEEPAPRIAVVAVSPGNGLSAIFQNLGAHIIVAGGQTMNPSTEELLKAIEEAPAQDIIFLPNNRNVILAARQAQSLTAKNVHIIPTRTVPEGISALMAFNYQSDLETNALLMTEAALAIQTGEVTRATRAVKLNGLEIQEGDTIGLHNGELCTKGDSPAEVAFNLLRRMVHQDTEIITLYYGQEIDSAEAQALADEIRNRYPAQEVELLSGQQPHYAYILSAE